MGAGTNHKQSRVEAAMLDGHEQVLLSALMNGTRELPITADDFSSPPNRQIFRCISELDNRSLIAITDALRVSGQLEAVGGAGRITEISQLPHDPDSLEYALGEVLEHSRQQRAAKIGGALRNGSITPEDAAAELDSFTSFNSLGSEAVDDFPEPLSDVAFYGLAGDIVSRVAPHTEADRAALLIQILTVFGNVIGRSAHATADGSRHGMNLFAVLVGETSKARKGTSLSHVLRVFERADEQWTRDCIGHGLSSGEGVIWAVRDPICKTVKNRRTGKFETQIVDGGIADKRLCVQEGEFANVLKVMAREGNTLSPVIRSAWDSGNLRSMTKNSEARATGAHVSIIGHITRDELRRLLTETESANGFANRFLFLAVRRSKCLPEGGNFDAESLNDLVVRLHKAIDFAWNAGEVTRDEDARELWRICYPALSEGKPGLVGAITARAEAQVLRLACIYALLDCSTKITVDHHRAALALWNYCQGSARWIFSTATGDSRADRILIGLRTAGTSGMTQTEISERIFQRNVSSAALSDALRVLERSGRAKCIRQTTGGRPLTKWIAS